MNDPRGILEVFVRACDGYRGSRGQRFDGVSANLDPESRRMAYRGKHEAEGVCRSCKVKAKPGRKYCEKHLAEAAKRVKGRADALRDRLESLEGLVRDLQASVLRICPTSDQRAGDK